MRPLPSASRVSSSERRLYSRVRELLDPVLANPPEDPEQVRGLSEFNSEVEKAWGERGYATLGNDGGRVPLVVTRHVTYNLLLLLRERGGRYDMLLSNHSPLRPSPLSDWNALLMPAFRDVRELLEHLRDDVMRQVGERAEDLERAAHAEAFEWAVNQILTNDERPGDDLGRIRSARWPRARSARSLPPAGPSRISSTTSLRSCR